LGAQRANRKRSKIADYPALAIRSLFRKIGQFQCSAGLAAAELSISLEEANQLMDNLTRQGFSEVCNESFDGVRWFELASLGLGLASATAAKPVSRRTVDRVSDTVAVGAVAYSGKRLRRTAVAPNWETELYAARA
jgi:hypothetical protein